VRHRRRAAGPIRRSLNIFRYGRDALSLKLLFWTVRLAETESRFDVIYCHFGTVGRTGAFLREIGVIEGTLVTAFHGVDVSASLRQDPGLYRHLFAHGEAFLPISRHWGKRLQAHGCDPDRIIVHHMGVDITRFRYRPRQPAGATRLLTVGRLVEKKGLVYALQAVRLARERGVRLRYTIVGDGPLRQSLEALAGELRIKEIVTFTGWYDQSDVVRQMYAHDVLVAPSVTDRIGDQEGIPVTLMEAMATGMPVISTRHSAIPELVTDGESGILVAEGDVEGLAGAIERLARDPATRTSMGRSGQSVVEAEFNACVLNQRLLALLRKMSCEPAGFGHADVTAISRGQEFEKGAKHGTPSPVIAGAVPDAHGSRAGRNGHRPQGDSGGHPENQNASV
jgi:colanic acid/amylovoran biosynthesis glycosyltransferase